MGDKIQVSEEELLTVIVPVYNVEAYLKRCVDSIICQTYKNLEIILVDDGSTDKGGVLCDDYTRQDVRIKTIHKENEGLWSARNAGLDIASGVFLGFVDSDDYIAPNMYERLHDLMVTNDADIACCNFEKIGEEGHISYKDDDLNAVDVFSREECYSMMTYYGKIAFTVCDKLFRREDFFAEYRFLPMLYEDVDASARCLTRANKVVYTGEPLYKYWMRPNSIVHRGFNMGMFDEMKSRMLIFPIYERYCPSQVSAIKASYGVIGINILRQSRADPDFTKSGNRKKLYYYLRTYFKGNKSLPYNAKQKVQIQLLKLGLPAFDLAFAMLDHIKRKNGCIG